jgi:hydrogenase expression/formation protein HypC
MCLGVPGQIVSVDDATAVVDFWGVQRQVALDLVDAPVAPGDYVLVHVGFALRRIDPAELDATLAFFGEMASEDLEGFAPPQSPARTEPRA